MKFPKNLYSRLSLITCITLITGYIFVHAYTTYYTDLPNVGTGAVLTSTSWNNLVNYANKAIKQDTEVLTVTGGKVGIGTASPGVKLNIVNTWLSITQVESSDDTTGSAAGFYAYAAGGGGTLLSMLAHGQSRVVSRYGLTLGSWTELTSGLSGPLNGMVVGTYQAKPLVFGTNNAERMRIDSSGNIGIGTTNPWVYKLYVNDTSSNAFALNSATTPVQRFQVWWADIWGFIGNYGSPNGLSIYNYNNPSIAMHFTSGGNVLIGTTTDAGYKLDVNGAVRGASWANSDRNLKKNIKTLSWGLDKIEKLRGVTYEWKDSSKGSGSQVGVIAQEIEEVFPELVHMDNQWIRAVNYAGLVAPLIEAVKELKKENDSLKQENGDIKSLLCLDHLTAGICQ